MHIFLVQKCDRCDGHDFTATHSPMPTLRHLTKVQWCVLYRRGNVCAYLLSFRRGDLGYLGIFTRGKCSAANALADDFWWRNAFDSRLSLVFLGHWPFEALEEMQMLHIAKTQAKVDGKLFRFSCRRRDGCTPSVNWAQGSHFLVFCCFCAALCKELAKERITICSPCARSCDRARLEKRGGRKIANANDPVHKMTCSWRWETSDTEDVGGARDSPRASLSFVNDALTCCTTSHSSKIHSGNAQTGLQVVIATRKTAVEGRSEEQHFIYFTKHLKALWLNLAFQTILFAM